MRKIKISAALERRIRSGESVNAELIRVLDEEVVQQRKPGLSYAELVEAFRLQLGKDLALPPNPQIGWIARCVNTAREYGLEREHIASICEAARRLYPGRSYEMDYLIRSAPRLLTGVSSSAGRSPGAEGVSGSFTSRPDPTE